MKKLKVLLSTFLFIVVGVLISTSILNNSDKKVKADPISYYYANVITTQPAYATIVVYIWDAVDLVDNSATIYLFGSNSVYQYSLIDSRNAEFVRDSSYDPSGTDYHAYRYSWNYSTISSAYTAIFLLFNWSSLAVDSIDISLTGDFICPYDPTYRTYYDQGYDIGYDDGADDTADWYEEYYSEGYEGYQTIFALGELEGYIQGQNSLDTMGWFSSISSGVGSVLNIKILPSITIGALVFIPLMFFILSGVLWIWRRK